MIYDCTENYAYFTQTWILKPIVRICMEAIETEEVFSIHRSCFSTVCIDITIVWIAERQEENAEKRFRKSTKFCFAEHLKTQEEKEGNVSSPDDSVWKQAKPNFF